MVDSPIPNSQDHSDTYVEQDVEIKEYAAKEENNPQH